MSSKTTLNKVLGIWWLMVVVAVTSLASCEDESATIGGTGTAVMDQDSTPVMNQTAIPIEELVSPAITEEPEIYVSPAVSNSSSPIEYSPPTCASIAASANQIVAFVSDRREKDKLDIWIIDVESEEQAVITSTTSQDWHPLWSPDGQKLAYLSAENQEDVYLVVVEFNTCETIGRLRMPDIVSFSWSADGTLLWLDTQSGILQHNILEGIVTQYSENTRSAAETPNGMFLAMRSQRDPELYLYDLLLQDREKNKLPVHFFKELDDVSVNDIAWAHHVPQLSVTFQPARQQHTGGISLLAFVDGTFEEIASLWGQEPSLDYCYPAWSPTDSYISYVVAWHYAEVPCLGDVYIAKDGLQQIFHISDNAITTQQPWSPTGTQIVFSQNARSPWWAPSRSYGFPGEGSIWVSNFDGSNPELLTDSDWYDGEAVWRP